MTHAPTNPLVHLELHTGDLPRACAFYSRLCGWCPERVDAGERSYLALGLGGGIEGGIVECDTDRPMWWRGVVAAPAGGEVALWQSKR